jgi:hypothetical protein
MSVKFSIGYIEPKSMGEDFNVSLKNTGNDFCVALNRLNKKMQAISYTRKQNIRHGDSKILFELGFVLSLMKNLGKWKDARFLKDLNFDDIFYKGKALETVKVIERYCILNSSKADDIYSLLEKTKNVKMKTIIDIIIDGSFKFDDIYFNEVKYTFMGLMTRDGVNPFSLLFNWKKYKNMKTYLISVHYVNSKEGEEAPY